MNLLLIVNRYIYLNIPLFLNCNNDTLLPYTEQKIDHYVTEKSVVN